MLRPAIGMPEAANMLHSGQLTWTLTGAPLKRPVVYRESVFRFHVSFPESSLGFRS